MTFERREPCKSCPYRKDAPEKLWHRSEFVKLLANDAQDWGPIYGCHEGKKLPLADQQVCIGWMLDQRRRGLPALHLRLLLFQRTDASDCMREATSGGSEMFSSIQTMCRANGVRA